jgi:hypothetical protein
LAFIFAVWLEVAISAENPQLSIIFSLLLAGLMYGFFRRIG